MRGTRSSRTIPGLSIGLLIGALFSASLFSQDPPVDQKTLEKLFQDGNYQEAYEGYRTRALDGIAEPDELGNDLSRALACLSQLQRDAEMDAFREAVIEKHRDNWKLLWAAANTYLGYRHDGYMVAGEFRRGRYTGSGEYVNAQLRDRARALQLFFEARNKVPANAPDTDLGNLMADLALGLNSNYSYGAWRLQVLTDLVELPDFEPGNYGYWSSGGGAPVDEKGDPVFHHRPTSFEEAKSDGERWRFALAEAARLTPSRSDEMDLRRAQFHQGQFAVRTMGHMFQPGTVKEGDESGPYALESLSDDETIARLATGVRRFRLPDEFNHVKIYQSLAETENSAYVTVGLEALAQIFQDRRQYSRAAAIWQQLADRSTSKDQKARYQALRQAIVGNLGLFEATMTQPATRGATVDYRFRNGKKVEFEAHAIDVEKLLDDVKKYIKSEPERIDRNRINISNIGYRLIENGEDRYVGASVAKWSLTLKPLGNHKDRVVTVTTPLREAGAYLLTARMADGNTSNVVLWVADTVIVRKNLEKGTYYFVADAATGAPIEKANVEFFGYRQTRNEDRKYDITTRNFARFTDADGAVINDHDDQLSRYYWLAVARTEAGRLAYVGFSSVWIRNYDRRLALSTRYFTITDRPVYRPDQTVHIKCWIGTPSYDDDKPSEYAGRELPVKIVNPRNETVLEQNLACDEYGGLEGSLALAGDATLGIYRVEVEGRRCGTFRVEEYKKPEFEVTIDAPTEPIQLGDRIKAKVSANYYFGGAVTEAKVKYKVLRTATAQSWYPPATWDWLFGPGYWWFGYDYWWYPGFKSWGCLRPLPWWHHRSSGQPEVVAEREVEIGADGTVSIEIDTAPAKAQFGDQDHQYSITAEVTDRSRRTIVGTGNVLAARQPFKVYVWPNQGYYRPGDTIELSVSARTLAGDPVQAKGSLELFKIRYDKGEPIETLVYEQPLHTDEQGSARAKVTAARTGQYRVSVRLSDARERTIEGGCLVTVHGDVSAGTDYRFNGLELVPEQKEYNVGDTAKILINTDRTDSTVVLFLRPVSGICLEPVIHRLTGKSKEIEIEVGVGDQPNFFVEAFTIADGVVHSETRVIVVPPRKRVLDLAVEPKSTELKPGEETSVEIRVTDPEGKPHQGAAVVAIYDKSVEYVSGGSNVPAIREIFWKWRRSHNPYTETSLTRYSGNLVPPGEEELRPIGMFGNMLEPEGSELRSLGYLGGTRELASKSKSEGGPANGGMAGKKNRRAGPGGPATPGAPVAVTAEALDRGGEDAWDADAAVQPTVRTNFADTALWAGSLVTDENGIAEVSLTMPENLTTWKVRAWTFGHGCRVGEGEAEVVTTKNLLLRLQAPRFFTEKDEVVLSANIHNHLATEKKARVVLELEGGCLELLGDATTDVSIPADGETRVDWRVRVVREGEAIVRMKALTDEESDAMEKRFPVHVHGMEKMDSIAGAIRSDANSASITFHVPEERRINQSRIELRYSPTLAGAMVDALPYLAEYPYGCTEQTLNRFLPTVVTRKTLIDLGLDLAAIQEKRTNLNAQEIGDDQERAKGWKRFDRNPVFDEKTVLDMTRKGLERLLAMQLSDGGWGWFSGYGERSYPHTTATVVHGLQVALASDVAVPPPALLQGVNWLKSYQARQIQELRNYETKTKPYKRHADNVDAMVYMVLADSGTDDAAMREFLYRDRTRLAVYSKAMFGLALHKLGDKEKLQMILRNIAQFVVQDQENETAWLRLPSDGWWYWYRSEFEAHAYYLKLLALTEPKGITASRIAKYIVNNRKHATYWKSTRDTALCIEALSTYLTASGEGQPDLTLEIYLDGEKKKEVRITRDNLFDFDNKLVVFGDAVTGGDHTIEIRKKGEGPLYYNLYSSYFSLEDFLTRTGLELKVQRRVYRLVRVDAGEKVAGASGQVVDQKIEKYRRDLLDDLATLKSGDLVEVELVIESKNDYEYLIFEDLKGAGFEPVDVRSGYARSGVRAYMELRDRAVTFFIQRLPRGEHSLKYRLRAEIPGRFAALPTRAYAMYAPELKGNSDEIRLLIND